MLVRANSLPRGNLRLIQASGPDSSVEKPDSRVRKQGDQEQHDQCEISKDKARNCGLSHLPCPREVLHLGDVAPGLWPICLSFLPGLPLRISPNDRRRVCDTLVHFRTVRRATGRHQPKKNPKWSELVCRARAVQARQAVRKAAQN